MSSEDSFISFMVGSYSQPQEETQVLVRVPRAKKAVEKKAEPAKIVGSQVNQKPLPEVQGRLDAETFLRRLGEFPQLDPRFKDPNYEAKRELLASYVTLQAGDIFGVMLERARLKAKKEVCNTRTNLLSVKETRDAVASVSGYTRGLPSDVRKRVADLLAREELSANALIEAENSSRSDKVLAVRLEQERLREIRQALRELLGE